MRQWRFEYHYSGAARFELSCGLHGSGKLYIQAVQVGKADNLQVSTEGLGLLADTVPSGSV